MKKLIILLCVIIVQAGSFAHAQKWSINTNKDFTYNGTVFYPIVVNYEVEISPDHTWVSPFHIYYNDN